MPKRKGKSKVNWLKRNWWKLTELNDSLGEHRMPDGWHEWVPDVLKAENITPKALIKRMQIIASEKLQTKVLPQRQAEIGQQSTAQHFLNTEYKKAAKALKAHLNEHLPFDRLFRTKKNKPLLANLVKKRELVTLTLKHIDEIDEFIKEFQIIENNEGLCLFEIRVVMAEMIWGKQQLNTNSPVVEAMRYYEESLREACLKKMITTLTDSFKNIIPELPTYVRVNELQITIQDAIQYFEKEGWQLLPLKNTYREHLYVVQSLRLNQMNFVRDFHIPQLLVFPPGTPFYDHPGVIRGKLILQDKGSCLSSYLLNPKPKSVVLDLCAAPGLKASHLACIMENKGHLYANDIHPERYAELGEFLGLTNVQCVHLSKTNIFETKVPEVDYVLVDPSCSYSGIFSKASQDDQMIERLFPTLSNILRYALQSFPTARRVVYTVSSMIPIECERVVQDAMKAVGDSYTLVDAKQMLSNEWINQGQRFFYTKQKKEEFPSAENCLRTRPKLDLCQGYFIAIFQRNFEIPIPPYKHRSIVKHITEVMRQADDSQPGTSGCSGVNIAEKRNETK